MVSLKDIAKACQVSVATVSKALNDHNDISAETKERIRQVAKDWDIFQTLRQRHSRQIVLIISVFCLSMKHVAV